MVNMSGVFLVTGGAGFIGSNLVDKLVNSGNDVLCIDNFSNYYNPSIKRRNIAPALATGNLRLLEGDICDTKMLEDLFRENSIDCVFHMAAQAGVRVSVENPERALIINTGGTLNILRCANKFGVKKMVNASSSSIFGKSVYTPMDENHPTSPISPYGVSKLAAEHYCRIFSEMYGIKTVSLRYFTVYGPRMRPDLAISIFSQKISMGEPIEIFGDGSQTRDFTFVDDVTDATMLARKKGDGPYNIGGGNSIKLNDLIAKLEKIIGKKANRKYVESMKGDMKDTLADNRKAKLELGWKPMHKIDDGLIRYVDWAKKNSLLKRNAA
jgi:UDP-glucose 4-epimerase